MVPATAVTRTFSWFPPLHLAGLSEIELSLQAGQLIFLLLTVKSFAYGTVLAIYTTCRKTGKGFSSGLMSIYTPPFLC